MQEPLHGLGFPNEWPVKEPGSPKLYSMSFFRTPSRYSFRNFGVFTPTAFTTRSAPAGKANPCAIAASWSAALVSAAEARP